MVYYQGLPGVGATTPFKLMVSDVRGGIDSDGYHCTADGPLSATERTYLGPTPIG